MVFSRNAAKPGHGLLVSFTFSARPLYAPEANRVLSIVMLMWLLKQGVYTYLLNQASLYASEANRVLSMVMLI